MREVAVTVVTVLLFALQITTGVAFPSTVPAFLWSSREDGFSSNGMKAVNYRTLSATDLAKSVLSEGGWSNSLCLGKEAEHPIDLALLFVGGELHSGDIFGIKHLDSSFVDFLKVSVARANVSLAFPYIVASEAVESLLISEFVEACGDKLANKVSFTESCFLDGGKYEKLSSVSTFRDYLVSRMEKRQQNGQADLAVFCQGSSSSSSRSESQILSELMSCIEQSGARYTILYVSDPLRPYPSYHHREVERFLSENGSVNATACDGVCLVKSSLLEGILVGIVLLIILISGLCCMAGIDTPTRFETTPQDS